MEHRDPNKVHIINPRGPDHTAPTSKAICSQDGPYLKWSQDAQLKDVTCLECLDSTEQLLKSQLADISKARAALNTRQNQPPAGEETSAEDQTSISTTRRPLLPFLLSLSDEERENFMRPLTTGKSHMVKEHLEKQGIPFT